MKKRRFKKRKKNYKLLKISLAFAIVFALVGTGYSLFFESLHITGSASTATYVIPDSNLRVDVAGPNYATGPWKSFTLKREYYNNVNLVYTILKLKYSNWWYRREKVYLHITNPYPFKMKSGSVTYETLQGNPSYVKCNNEDNSLERYQEAYFRCRINYRSSQVGQTLIKSTHKYVVNGITKYFIWYIRLEP